MMILSVKAKVSVAGIDDWGAILIVFLCVLALALDCSSICSHLPGLHGCNALDDYVT